MPAFIVQRLRVESMSDATPDPYGQAGFSALIAYVERSDAIASELRTAAEEKVPVKIKCASLEIEGHISEMQFADNRSGPIAISVDDLRYFKPSHELKVERRKLD